MVRVELSPFTKSLDMIVKVVSTGKIVKVRDAIAPHLIRLGFVETNEPLEKVIKEQPTKQAIKKAPKITKKC